MKHRHLDTTDWTPMAVESLFDRGELADWQDFVRAMRQNPELGRTALRLAAGHEDGGSAALARLLVSQHQPGVAATLIAGEPLSLRDLKHPLR